MYTYTTRLRVRYSETDRMGYAYYGNYATYFEVARVEALRNIGVNYRELEDNGILLPVADFTIKYHKPAYYDDVLIIQVTVNQMPTAKIVFEYKTFNEHQVLLCTGSTTLVFVDKETGKPRPAPKDVIQKLNDYVAAN